MMRHQSQKKFQVETRIGLKDMIEWSKFIKARIL